MTLVLREGGYYMDGYGDVWGPMEPHSSKVYPWMAYRILGSTPRYHADTWTHAGIWNIDKGENVLNLISEYNADGSPIESIDFGALNQKLTRALSCYMAEVETSRALHEENAKLKAEIEKLKPKPVTTSRWYNIYINHVIGSAFDSKMRADTAALSSRLAVLRIDYTDGVYSVHLEDL